MNRDQYRRANRTAFMLCITIIVSMFILVVAGNIKTGNVSGIMVVDIISAVTGAVMCFAGILKYQDSRTGCILITTGASQFYVVLMVIQNAMDMFAIGYAILFSAMVYLSYRLIIMGNAIIIISFLIELIRTVVTEGKFEDIYFKNMVIVVLATYASISTVRMLVKFHSEDNEILQSDAKEKAEAGRKMAEIAGTISELFNKSDKYMQQLNEIIDSCNSGMKNIADSTESTAQEVTAQTVKCQEILDETKTVDERRLNMTEASQNAVDIVSDGEKTIDNLRQKSDIVANASKVTVNSTRAVLDKVDDVQSIVGTIMSISKQTTLLALNASIEAARAGDAGRGFAVVAHEIGELSEQTNKASTEITRIITELTKYANEAMESIDNTVKCVDEQNVILSDTEDSFKSIHTNVIGLIDRFDDIGEGMKTIVRSATEINDSVNTLSATSEEVASLSNEGTTMTDDAVQKCVKLGKVLSNIAQEVDNLSSVNGAAE